MVVTPRKAPSIGLPSNLQVIGCVIGKGEEGGEGGHTPKNTRRSASAPNSDAQKIDTQHNKYTQKIANKAPHMKTDAFLARTGPDTIKNEIKMCPKKQFNKKGQKMYHFKAK